MCDHTKCRCLPIHHSDTEERDKRWTLAQIVKTQSNSPMVSLILFSCLSSNNERNRLKISNSSELQFAMLWLHCWLYFSYTLTHIIIYIYRLKNKNTYKHTHSLFTHSVAESERELVLFGLRIQYVSCVYTLRSTVCNVDGLRARSRAFYEFSSLLLMVL